MGNQNQRQRSYGDESGSRYESDEGGRVANGNAIGSGDFNSVLPDANDRRLHTEAVTSLAPVHPGLLLSGSKDATVALFDFRRHKKIHHWAAHEKEVTSVAYLTPRGGGGSATPPHLIPRAVTASRDKSIKIWSLGQEAALRTLTGHALVVTSLSLDPRATSVVSGSRDNSVRLWDVETGACVAKNQLSRNLVTDLEWSNEGQFIAQTSEDKEVKILDSRDLSVARRLPRKLQIQTSVDVSADDRLAATSSNGFGGAGCEVTVWDLGQGRPLAELRGHTETTNAVKFLDLNGDSTQFIVTASNDCSLRVWNLNTKEEVGKLNIPGSGPLTSIAVFPDGVIGVASFNSGVVVAKFDPNPDWSNQAIVRISSF